MMLRRLSDGYVTAFKYVAAADIGYLSEDEWRRHGESVAFCGVYPEPAHRLPVERAEKRRGVEPRQALHFFSKSGR